MSPLPSARTKGWTLRFPPSSSLFSYLISEKGRYAASIRIRVVKKYIMSMNGIGAATNRRRRLLDLNAPPPVDDDDDDDVVEIVPFHVTVQQQQQVPNSSTRNPEQVHVLHRSDGWLLGFPGDHDEHERMLTNRGIISSGQGSAFTDYHCAKRKEVVNLIQQPAKVARREPKFTCPICTNECVQPFSTICGHIFCELCIKMSIRHQKKCPSCRGALTMKSYHRIYLPIAK